MNSSQREHWKKVLKAKIESTDLGADPAHDLAHFIRVSTLAERFCEEEGARWEIVYPAAWLHDLINVPKNDPRRSQASRLSAQAASEFLEAEGFPAEHLAPIRHAIEAHSYSAAIVAETLEAKIVQDADRLDGLGAIGIARCFAVTGLLRRSLYHPSDAFAHDRSLDDMEYAVDHFYKKLFKTVETLQTSAGQAEGKRRAEFMRAYLRQLGSEIGQEGSD